MIYKISYSKNVEIRIRGSPEEPYSNQLIIHNQNNLNLKSNLYDSNLHN